MASQTFTINTPSNISAVFDKQGSKNARVRVTGTGSANISFTLDWSDNPGVAGDAIDSISLNGMNFNSPGDNGSQTRDRVFTPGDYNINFSGLLNDFKAVNNKNITMVDNDGDDTNATFSMGNIDNITTTTTITVVGDITASPSTMVGTNVFSLGWSSSGATSVTIDGVAVAANGSRSENTGLQSVAGSNSPATRTYTIQACNGSNCVSESVTVSVFNDCTPSGCTSTPSTTTTGVAINNLAQNTLYILQMGSVTGIDMPIQVTAVSPTDLQVSKSGGSWSNSITLNNNESFQLRFTSPAYNTDPSGQLNPKTLTWQVGCLSSNCSLTVYTRAPDVNETFDFISSTNFYPFPDIDANPAAAQQYMQAVNFNNLPDVVTVNDVDIPVEFKVNRSGTQARIKRQGSATYEAWQTWT